MISDCEIQLYELNSVAFQANTQFCIQTQTMAYLTSSSIGAMGPISVQYALSLNLAVQSSTEYVT
eukprot:5058986-Amphidinium_carterae.1